MISMLIRNKVRETVQLARGNWFIAIGAIILVVILLDGPLGTVMIFLQSTPVIGYSIIALLYFYLALMRSSPIFILNPATVFLMKGTKSFNKLFNIKRLSLALQFAILTLFIGWFFLAISNSLTYILIFTSFYVLALVAWQRYNKSMKTSWCILLLVAEIGALFLYPIIGIAVNTILTVILITKKPSIVWDSYFDEMRKIYTLNAMVARKDMVQLSSVANEHTARDNHKLRFQGRLTEKNPLLAKSIVIDLIRQSRLELIFSMFVFVIAIALYLSGLLGSFSPIASGLVLAVSYNMIIRTDVLRVREMQNKRICGLFLPASNFQLSLAYSVWLWALLIILNSIACVLFSKSYVIWIASTGLLCLVGFGGVLLTSNKPKLDKEIDYIVMLSVVLVVFFCFIVSW